MKKSFAIQSYKLLSLIRSNETIKPWQPVIDTRLYGCKFWVIIASNVEKKCEMYFSRNFIYARCMCVALWRKTFCMSHQLFPAKNKRQISKETKNSYENKN